MKTLLLLLPIFLVGCCDTEECKAQRAAEMAAATPTSTVMQKRQEQSAPAPVVANKRITVERVDVIYDILAYGEKRGVYIITDTKTGQEYIGVSGIGISEMGAHKSGKSTSKDER